MKRRANPEKIKNIVFAGECMTPQHQAVLVDLKLRKQEVKSRKEYLKHENQKLTQ